MNYITRVYTVVQVTVLVLTCTECARGFEETCTRAHYTCIRILALAHLMSLWLICRLWPLPLPSVCHTLNQNVDDEPPSRSASPLP